MKIALCLHGYFDSLQDPTSLGINGYNYIKKHILDKGDVDVFIHSWDKDREDEISALYDPVKATFEYQKDFSETLKKLQIEKLKWQARSPANVLSHFYSIQEAFNLCYEDYPRKSYDFVIKSRFDLGQINRNTSGPGRGNPYPVQCINFNPRLYSGNLYMANWGMMDQGPPDMWFYGNAWDMRYFNAIYDRVEEYLTWGSNYTKYYESLNGEVEISNSVRLYKWWMQEVGLWDKRVALDSEWE